MSKVEIRNESASRFPRRFVECDEAIDVLAGEYRQYDSFGIDDCIGDLVRQFIFSAGRSTFVPAQRCAFEQHDIDPLWTAPHQRVEVPRFSPMPAQITGVEQAHAV